MRRSAHPVLSTSQPETRAPGVREGFYLITVILIHRVRREYDSAGLSSLRFLSSIHVSL